MIGWVFRIFLVVSLALGGGVGAAMAEGLSLSRKKTAGSLRIQSSFATLNRHSAKYDFSSRLAPVTGSALLPTDGSARRSSYRGPYLAWAQQAARRHGVPQDIFVRLVQQESGWDAAALSVKGAVGLAQLMPETAQGLAVNPQDPQENLDGGARYLRQMYDRFGSWRLALAAYNAGPRAVETHGGVPPFAETQGYIRAILGS